MKNRTLAYAAAFTLLLLLIPQKSRVPRAETPEETDKRKRRLAFYLRNGLRDADVKATVYGVQFKILTLPVGRALSREEVRQKYAALYRALLPESLFQEKVFIHPDGE